MSERSEIATTVALVVLAIMVIVLMIVAVISLPPSPEQTLHNCILACEGEFGVGNSLHRACVEGCQRVYEETVR